MCFTPRRTLFEHLNFQKCSEPGVFCTFSLGNVLRATMACTFSTSQLPEVLRTWCVLIFFTCKCASRHNSMHFFDISPSKSAPNLVCVLYILTSTCSSRHNGVQFQFLIWPHGSAPAALASLLFDPPEPQIIGQKHSVSRLSDLFPCIFFLLTLSFLWSSLFFSSLLFSDSSHLCFSSVHIVGSLTSKLPSMIFMLSCRLAVPSWPRLWLGAASAVSMASPREAKLGGVRDEKSQWLITPGSIADHHYWLW